MPSSWARRVISWANRASVPPTRSAKATAASLADFTVSPRIACRTLSESPAGTPSLEGACSVAQVENGTRSSMCSRPVASASKVR